MTIPNTNVSLQDFNRNLRRSSLTNTVTTSDVGAFNLSSTSNVSFSYARSRLSNPLSAPPGWSYVLDYGLSGAMDNDYCNTLTVTSGSGTLSSGKLLLLTQKREYGLKSPEPTNVNLAAYNGPWALNLIVNVSSTGPDVTRFVTLGPGGDISTSSIRYEQVGPDIILQFFCFDQNSNFTSVTGGSNIRNTDMTVKVTRLGTTITLFQNGTQVGTGSVASNATFDFSQVRLGDTTSELFIGSITEFSMSRLGL
jgi:hypothetical protein